MNIRAVVTVNLPPIATAGGAAIRLLQMASQEMTWMILHLGGVTPQSLGLTQIANNLPTLVGTQSNLFTYQTLLPNMAFNNRFFLAFTQMNLMPGIDSWQEAFLLMDPNRQSVAVGQQNVINFVQTALAGMISDNLYESYFYFTRQVIPGGMGAQFGQVCVLGFYVNIDTYTP